MPSLRWWTIGRHPVNRIPHTNGITAKNPVPHIASSLLGRPHTSDPSVKWNALNVSVLLHFVEVQSLYWALNIYLIAQFRIRFLLCTRSGIKLLSYGTLISLRALGTLPGHQNPQEALQMWILLDGECQCIPPECSLDFEVLWDRESHRIAILRFKKRDYRFQCLHNRDGLFYEISQHIIGIFQNRAHGGQYQMQLGLKLQYT